METHAPVMMFVTTHLLSVRTGAVRVKRAVLTWEDSVVSTLQGFKITSAKNYLKLGENDLK